MDGGPSEEEDDSDDSTATAVMDDHTAKDSKAFTANPSMNHNHQRIVQNPFERIAKETDKFLRAASRLKQTKKLYGQPCIDDVIQDDIVSCR